MSFMSFIGRETRGAGERTRMGQERERERGAGEREREGQESDKERDRRESREKT